MIYYLQMIIAGYISAVHGHLQEENARVTPGNTPVRRRRNKLSQSQTQTQEPGEGGDSKSKIETYSQELITGDMTMSLFS